MLANSEHLPVETLPGTMRNLRAQLAELSRALSKVERALEQECSSPKPPVSPSSSPRSRPGFGYVLFGQAFAARNGNDVMVSVLRHFAELDPEFPERFSWAVHELGRKRPYVARTQQGVYPGKPELCKYTEVFAPGWYVGTNESNEKKRNLLHIACKVFGFRFGEDLKVRI